MSSRLQDAIQLRTVLPSADSSPTSTCTTTAPNPHQTPPDPFFPPRSNLLSTKPRGTPRSSLYPNPLAHRCFPYCSLSERLHLASPALAFPNVPLSPSSTTTSNSLPHPSHAPTKPHVPRDKHPPSSCPPSTMACLSTARPCHRDHHQPHRCAPCLRGQWRSPRVSLLVVASATSCTSRRHSPPPQPRRFHQRRRLQRHQLQQARQVRRDLPIDVPT